MANQVQPDQFQLTAPMCRTTDLTSQGASNQLGQPVVAEGGMMIPRPPGIQPEKVSIVNATFQPPGIQQEKVHIVNATFRPPGIQQENVSIKDGSQEVIHEHAELSSAQHQSDTSSKHKVTPQAAVNLAVPDEEVSELAEGPEVVNPGGQKRKAENEATYNCLQLVPSHNEVAEVSKEIVEFGDVLCAAFKSWKESLVKPKSVKDSEDDGKTPVNKVNPTSTTEEEKPALADGFEEEEVRRDPAQEVQAVSKSKATKEVVFFGTHGIHSSPSSS